MDYAIRDMRQDEFPLLEEFLYQAIWVSEGFKGEVPRTIVREDPKCRVAFEGFGTLPDDRAVVAELSGEVVGACWVRTTDEYGHIDDATPSFSISLYAAHRGNGIGTALMQHMISRLKKAGYDRASLSVQKTNPAVRLYQRLGFTVVGNGFDETEWLMVIPLCKPALAMATDRLLIRPWLVSDARELYVLASDDEVGPNAGWDPHTSEAQSKETIEGSLSAASTFAVLSKENGNLIGCVALLTPEIANVPLRKGELELGFWVGRPYWGNGYATEAALRLMRYAIMDLNATGIWAAYYEGNTKSRNVLSKLGFKEISIIRSVPCKLPGGFRNEILMYLSGDTIV